MKELKLFCKFLIIFMIFLSCSSENNSNIEISSLIIGNWKPISEIAICNSTQQEVSTLDSCEQMGSWIINENHSITISEYYTSTNNDCELDFTNSGNWSINDNTLNITLGNETVSAEIIELTNNTLKIEFDADDNTICNDGSSILKIHGIFEKNE
ncbi:lipocalin-like domain-containing protein [Tenacibaculum geojense]|uniref:Lipocalin family protein n=1 Tax=Tenacibaculum geojense TaxID=915352 RepID=A0ABW3JS34_9FLAO